MAQKGHSTQILLKLHFDKVTFFKLVAILANLCFCKLRFLQTCVFSNLHFCNLMILNFFKVANERMHIRRIVLWQFIDNPILLLVITIAKQTSQCYCDCIHVVEVLLSWIMSSYFLAQSLLLCLLVYADHTYSKVHYIRPSLDSPCPQNASSCLTLSQFAANSNHNKTDISLLFQKLLLAHGHNFSMSEYNIKDDESVSVECVSQLGRFN